jgi:hypothetical protein
MKSIRLAIIISILSLSTAVWGQDVVPPPRPPDAPEGISVDPDPAQMQKILDDLHAGLAKSASDRASELLRSYPDSIVLNCAAAEAAVVSNERLAVHLALDRLKSLAPGQECVTRLDRQYNRMTDPALRERALDLVRAGNLEGARQLVISAHLGPSEDLMIQHYLDRAQTHFTNALLRLQQLERTDKASAEKVAALKKETLLQAHDFMELRESAQKFLFTPVGTSFCTPKSARDDFARANLSFSDFFTLSRNLAREYPSNPDVQQVRFMALLLHSPKSLPEGPEDPLMRYGNSVLEKYGTLSIPFFSRDDQYLLVLDHTQQHITLKVNPTHPKNNGTTDGLRIGQTFDLDYSKVGSLHQSVGSVLPIMGLSQKTAAVDLGAQGLAPYYAMMPVIHCMYGEHYSRRATARLGKFLSAELAIPAVNVKLVDPNGTTHDYLSTAMAIGTIATMVAGQVGISQEQTLVANNRVVDPNLPLEQLQTQSLQSQGQEVLQDLADDSAERKDAEDAQKEDSESMEVELAQQGFDQAFDLDVPGYIEVLAALLRKH